MFRRSLILLSGILLSLLATAQTPNPKVKTLGFNDSSCSAWMASKDIPEQRKEYVAWARGFLSGHNYANQQQVTDFSPATVEQYIERYCKEKPKGLFTDAAYRMSDEYSGRKMPITR